MGEPLSRKGYYSDDPLDPEEIDHRDAGRDDLLRVMEWWRREMLTWEKHFADMMEQRDVRDDLLRDLVEWYVRRIAYSEDGSDDVLFRYECLLCKGGWMEDEDVDHAPDCVAGRAEALLGGDSNGR